MLSTPSESSSPWFFLVTWAPMSSSYKAMTNINTVNNQTDAEVTNRRWKVLTESQDIFCEIMYPKYNRESAPMKSKNYGHLNKP